MKSFIGKLAYLSNMLAAPITVEYKGNTYTATSSESLYQASKAFNDSDFAQLVSMNGYNAKKAGRKVAMKPNYNRFKHMLRVVYLKFDQHPELAAKLMIEPDENLVEHNDWNDTYWGVCNGKGLNNLGHILQALKKHLNGHITYDEYMAVQEKRKMWHVVFLGENMTRDFYL